MPTPNSDIIGIAKELQEMEKQYAYQKSASLGDAAENTRKIWTYNICRSFSDISQALLIAVEALEEHEPGGCSCASGCEKCWVRQTLLQIRSLPVHD